MAIPIIRLFTGPDGESHFEDTEVELHERDAANALSKLEDVREIQFQETVAHHAYDWHCAPRRQYVITLTGTLEFETRLGEKRMITPGSILLAEDKEGCGHKWRLVDDQPWRRIYLHLEP
jgi:hypothetical protein